MATNPYPAGIGNDQQAMQATAAMRQEPWYAELLQSWGIDPTKVDANGNPRTKLSDDQRTQLMQTAIDRGIGFNHKYDGIDENGQIIEEHHKLRNSLVAAAIGGAAATGFGAAGMGPLAGMFGSTAAAAPAAAATTAGGVLPSTVIGSGFIPAIAGGTGMGAAGAAGTAAGTVGTLSKIAGLLPGVGQSIGAATQAAGQNDLNQEELALKANESNITGTRSDVVNQTDIAKANAQMAARRLRNEFALSVAGSPPVGPMGVKGGLAYSPAFMEALAAETRNPATPLKAPTPYTPINIKDVQGATNTAPGTLQKIGEWLGPATTIGSKILPLFH
jgi:hypothetical protein